MIRHLIDHQVIGMHNIFPCTVKSATSIEVGIFGEGLCNRFYSLMELQSRYEVMVAKIIQDFR